MSETSAPPNLRDRLRHKMREDRALLDRAIEIELQNFAARFRHSASTALTTIENDTLSRSQPLARSLRRAWLIPLVVGLSLSVGLSGGSWAVARHLSRSVQERIAELAQLEAEITNQRRILGWLRSDTSGIDLIRHRNEEFLVLPSGTKLDQNWTVGDRPAVKLSRP